MVYRRGKDCPTQARIDQIPGLIERARRIVAGGKDDDMSAADVDAINKHTDAKINEIYNLLGYGDQRVDTDPDTHPFNLQNLAKKIDDLAKKIDDLAKKIDDLDDAVGLCSTSPRPSRRRWTSSAPRPRARSRRVRRLRELLTGNLDATRLVQWPLAIRIAAHATDHIPEAFSALLRVLDGQPDPALTVVATRADLTPGIRLIGRFSSGLAHPCIIPFCLDGGPMQYMKAVVGALIAGLGTLATALSDGGIQTIEWVWVAIAFLTALGGVWAVPNATPQQQAEHRLAEAGESGEKISGYPGGILPPPTTRATGSPWSREGSAPPD